MDSDGVYALDHAAIVAAQPGLADCKADELVMTWRGKEVPIRVVAKGEHFADGDRGVSEWTFRGTAADGSRIEAEGCDLFTFENGKIVRKQAFRKNRPVLQPRY